ncbi:hypothetical protein C2E23DRAFT_802429 [Lenzites betulinus]|nr:hypothetical protein C2E23DRAFT_802429 [Lenzites betulinus]
MQRVVELPTGPRPGWELDEPHQKETDLKSVPESYVVLQSLRQSRNKWMSTVFPKFSVKTRGSKAAEVTPPPHTTKAHGKYDLHIGPHVFLDTSVYEVHYLPISDPQTEGFQPLPSAVQPGTSSGVQTPLQSIPCPTPGTYVTPALSSKVTLAAQSNPVLANLLKAVIDHTATEDQVKTLGLLIQSLEGVHSTEQPSPVQHGNVSSPSFPRPLSPRTFDVVLEFHERSSERFVIPRGDFVCELAAPKAGATHRGSDVIITLSLPFGETITPAPISPEVVSLRISRVSQALWELLTAWAGGLEKIEESRAKLREMVRQASARAYLQHRLPEGELLEEVKNAVAPPYTFKSVKPAGADSNRAKRKSVTRRPTVTIANPPAPATPAEKPAEKPAGKLAEKPPPPVKRRSQQKAKAPAPPPIACHSCGQTDVPLMMGGRFCRECINAGRATAEIPQVQPGRANMSPPGVHVFSASTSTTPTRTVVATPYAVHWVPPPGPAAPVTGPAPQSTSQHPPYPPSTSTSTPSHTTQPR